MTEMALVGTILELIALRGGVATRINAGMQFIEGANGKRRCIHGAPAGTSDILACYRSHYLAVEAKVWPNKPTASQRAFLENVERAGGIGIVAYDVETVERALDRIDADA